MLEQLINSALNSNLTTGVAVCISIFYSAAIYFYFIPIVKENDQLKASIIEWEQRVKDLEKENKEALNGTFGEVREHLDNSFSLLTDIMTVLNNKEDPAILQEILKRVDVNNGELLKAIDVSINGILKIVERLEKDMSSSGQRTERDFMELQRSVRVLESISDSLHDVSDKQSQTIGILTAFNFSQGTRTL